jgi:hypothetical protein
VIGACRRSAPTSIGIICIVHRPAIVQVWCVVARLRLRDDGGRDRAPGGGRSPPRYRPSPRQSACARDVRACINKASLAGRLTCLPGIVHLPRTLPGSTPQVGLLKQFRGSLPLRLRPRKRTPTAHLIDAIAAHPCCCRRTGRPPTLFFPLLPYGRRVWKEA